MASVLNVILRVTGQSSLGGTFTGLNQGLQLAQAGVDALNNTVGQFVRRGFEMNASLETTTLQFKTLMGSADEAQKHVADLFKLGAETPFTTGEIIEASRSLEVLGGSALDTHDNILLVGDAAAATSANIRDVAFWTGRAYSAIEAGRPFGEAAQRLQELGILSADARNRMEDMQKAGASASEVWKVLDTDFRRFNGAMVEQAGTWAGLTSTMSDSFDMLAAHVTQPAFQQAETDLKGINAALSDPQTTQNAEAIGQAIGFIADEGTRLGGTLVATSTAFQALNVVLNIFGPTTAAAEEATDAFSRHKNMVDALTPAMAAMVPIQNQVRDAWQEEAHAADEAALSFRGVRDEMERIGAQQPILNQQRQTAHDAEMQRLYDEGQALAHAGDINQIVAQEQISAQQFAAKQAEDAAKEAAKAQEDAFREASDAIRQKNQETADAIRAAQQASQEAVRRAYLETADEAEAQFQRIASAAAPMVDTLSQQLDEAVNRQVRDGIAGTADAEKQLDDIRRQHLATLPDLVALDREYAAAQGQVHDADVAVALAQRNLQVALARTGGAQTLQTAALAHAVTAAEAADQAAKDHAASLGQERSQAISDTNALRGLAAQRKALADDAATRQIGGPANTYDPNLTVVTPSGAIAPPMADAFGNNWHAQDIRGGVSLADFNRGVRSQEWRALHLDVTVNNNGGAIGVDDLGRRIVDTVNTGLRNGAVRVPGLATR